MSTSVPGELVYKESVAVVLYLLIILVYLMLIGEVDNRVSVAE